MNKELIELIIKTVVTLLCALITGYVVPYIKSKVSDAKLKEIEKYATIAVRAAEQVFQTDEWQEKKQYAVRYISEKATKIGLKLSTEDVESIVESTVNFVKYGSEYNK